MTGPSPGSIVSLDDVVRDAISIYDVGVSAAQFLLDPSKIDKPCAFVQTLHAWPDDLADVRAMSCS